ncbi:MAG: POTRA domain-containing protein [Rhizomicrobium sp.]
MGSAIACGFAGDAVAAQSAVPASSPVPAPAQPTPPQPPAAPSAPLHLDINEYRIEGEHLLPQDDVETAVYPFLGPGRTTDDVEKARAALEAVYKAKGYQTVAVQVPPQRVSGGVVTLKVVEGTVGRLRVNGARYFLPDAIRQDAPSLAEGTTPNFNDVQRDIVALNQQPDRRVTPALRAGETPGTVDVDLNVDDTLPLHANLEINNRYSSDTTHTRLNATVHYDNLWQLGHSLSFTYQVAPERPSDAEVYSLSYLARIPGISWLSLLAYGVKQDSDVSTIGDINVAGRGEIAGARAIFTLPYEDGFFHTLSLGFDYKHFDQGVTLGGQTVQAPITYYPLTAAYSATWAQDGALTQLDTSVTFHLRGLGSDPVAFDTKRFKASGDFIYFRADLSRAQDLPLGFQAYVKVQGQLSDEPLVSAEELSGGGLDTVRGYLESETLGDNGGLGTFELRSPYLPGLFGKTGDKFFISDWRIYGFTDGGMLTINQPLPDQKAFFPLLSVGGGTRFELFHHLNGSVDAGVPLITQTSTKAGQTRLSLRAWVDF